MATESTLKVEKREKLGSAESRRLRAAGRTPGNIYGHGEGSVAIVADADELAKIVHEGHRALEIEIEGKPQTAIFREVQWDTFITTIKHFDLLRVDPNERVAVEVPVELRGVAVGVVDENGVLEQHCRSVELECRAINIPDVLIVRIAAMKIGDTVHVSDLEFPDGNVMITPGDTLVCQIVEPTEISDEDIEGDDTGGIEPELIGRKDGEEGDGDDE